MIGRLFRRRRGDSPRPIYDPARHGPLRAITFEDEIRECMDASGDGTPAPVVVVGDPEDPDIIEKAHRMSEGQGVLVVPPAVATPDEPPRPGVPTVDLLESAPERWTPGPEFSATVTVAEIRADPVAGIEGLLFTEVTLKNDEGVTVELVGMRPGLGSRYRLTLTPEESYR